jgi:hypothetical protein
MPKGKKSSNKRSSNTKLQKLGRQNPGDLVLDVHSQINLTMDSINIRRVDLALLPSNFDVLVRAAASYQRYRVESLEYRFYNLRNVSFQQGANSVYPLIVY